LSEAGPAHIFGLSLSTYKE